MSPTFSAVLVAAVLCYTTQVTLSQGIIYSINDLYSTADELKSCPYRMLINGQSSPTNSLYASGSTVTYSCDQGYRLLGSLAAKCEDGEWSKSIPFCIAKPKACSRRLLKHGSSIPNSARYTDQTIVTYECHSGYVLKGTNSATCLDGQWSEEIPICKEKPKTCSFRALEHGSVSPEKPFYDEQSVVVYSCNDGYDLEGSIAAACFDAKWSKPLPICTASKSFSPSDVYCPAPSFARGSYAPQPMFTKSYAVGSFISFKCRGSYILKGSRTAECLPGGKWDQVPVCQVGCSVPQIANGFYNTDAQPSGSHFEPGQMVTFACNPTYKLKGSSSAICQSNGRWSRKFPVCEKWIITVKEVGCVPPVFPLGSYTPALTMGKKAYSVGETIAFKCLTGYYTQGANFATCRTDGSWSKIPTCSDECAPPTIDGGTILPANGPYKIDTTILLNCNTGYLPVGPSQATCLPGGVWSATLKCSDGCYAPTIAHMKILPAPASGGNVYEFGHRIRFSCDAGFSTNVREAECRGGNRWDKALPKCRLLAAGAGCPMPVLPEGLVLKNQRQNIYEYKTQLEFSCGKGFSMVGSAVSICRKHLRGQSAGWDPALPVCNRAKCGAPGKPQNGRFRDGEKEAYYFGDTVYFKCDEKHIMSGNEHITCQADGQFSGIPPKCQPPSCRVECKYVEGRDCQCDAPCRIRKNCCYDFEQHCRKLFY